MTISQYFVMLVFLGMSFGVWCVGLVHLWKWLIWGLRDGTVTRCPTCGHSAQTATEESTSGDRQV